MYCGRFPWFNLDSCQSCRYVVDNGCGLYEGCRIVIRLESSWSWILAGKRVRTVLHSLYVKYHFCRFLKKAQCSDFKRLRVSHMSNSPYYSHTLQPAIWTTDAIGNSDHIYVTRNDR